MTSGTACACTERTTDNGEMPRLDELVDALTAGGRRTDRMCHVEHRAARPAQHSAWPQWVHPAVRQALTERGASSAWTHQATAAQAIHDGHHVALATSTGSGKSLAFWVPALTSIMSTRSGGSISRHRDRATALYLAPTKALAHDQLAALQKLLSAGGLDSVRVDAVDGDTSFDERRWVQAHGDIILTNPDFLHYALLPGHERWSRFLRGLEFLIIDEGHTYRGVFGAHVSLIVRRLQRLVAHYRGGRMPVVVVASATSAHPQQSAARLIGVSEDEVVAVTEDGSPSGRQTIVLWQPPQRESGFTQAPSDVIPGVVDELTGGWDHSVDDDLTGGADDLSGVITDAPVPSQPRRPATAEAVDLLADLTAHGARTLAFTRSRRAAEYLAVHTRDELLMSVPQLADSVAAYRGGFLPEERRALEAGVRSGSIRALASTNALEMGIDISGLDVVLIVGWPGTRMSLWQQAGRAGRAGSDGLVVFIAREDPLDTYVVSHPEAIFGAPLEATVFDPTNPYVLGGHLCAAAAELPVTDADLTLFGGCRAREVLDQLVDRGTLRRRPRGWYWVHDEPAAQFTSIRGDGQHVVQVVERSTGRLLGTVDAGAADGQVHDGAVYTHGGSTFVVAHYDVDNHVALVDQEVVAYSTWSRDVTSIEIVSTASERVVPAEVAGDPALVEWGFGQVNVHGQVTGFTRRRVPSGEVLGHESLDLPVRTLPTAAVWWSVSTAVLERAGLAVEEVPGALHAAEHAAIGLLPLLVTCDRWDLGGVSTAIHPDTERATVFVYDALPGGAGFAEQGFARGREWLLATRDAVARCQCVDGCPSCVQSPKCGNGNSPLSKEGAIRLLTVLLEVDVGELSPADAPFA